MNLYNYLKQKNFTDYFLLIALLSLYFALSIIYDISQIHIYKHDDMRYMITQDDYLGKVQREGRWINYLFFPIVQHMPGNLLAIFILISFAYFIFYSAYKWTENKYYSLLVSLLFFQIPSSYELILWPSTSSPTFLILLLSILLTNRLPIFIFYILFGILFFGVLSNYYYLLPLLHLNLLKNAKNTKFIFFKIIIAWATGFIIGYAATQAILYIWFGHFMQISTWREPNYINSIDDLIVNIKSSLYFFIRDIKSIFSSYWLIFMGLMGGVISICCQKRKDLLLFSIIIFSLITVIHYIIVIPIGILISPRTIVATWVGIFAILFFTESIKKEKVVLLTPIIILFTYNLYLKNHQNLKWYATIKNIYYDSLKDISPLPTKNYEGLVLFSNNKEIEQKTYFLSKINNLHRDIYIHDIDTFLRWTTIATEAGFKHVILCDGYKGYTTNWDKEIDTKMFCYKIIRNYITKDLLKNTPTNGIYNLIGEYQNFLLVSFDNKNLMKIKQFQTIINNIEKEKPIISSKFNVYFYKNNLIFYKKECQKDDIKHTFFLHVIPKNKNDLPKNRLKYGFQNMDFNFYENGGIIENNQCFIQIKLPDYKIKKIETGQYQKNKRDWEATYFFQN